MGGTGEVYNPGETWFELRPDADGKAVITCGKCGANTEGNMMDPCPGCGQKPIVLKFVAAPGITRVV